VALHGKQEESFRNQQELLSGKAGRFNDNTRRLPHPPDDDSRFMHSEHYTNYAITFCHECPPLSKLFTRSGGNRRKRMVLWFFSLGRKLTSMENILHATTE
jgi:hypothetical protein